MTVSSSRTRLARWLHPAAIRHRLAVRASSTPGRLTLIMAGLAALATVAGLAAVIGAAGRAGEVEQVGAQSGPLTVQAQQLYRSLSDADATAAAAFLSSGTEPPALRQRYQTDIASAGAALATVTATQEGDSADVAQISQSLPVYSGLVETARTYNRLNLPVAGAYLREASGLMRERLLPAAERLYRAESERLAADRDGASSAPWLAILLLLLTLAGLVLAQRYLVQRTRRLVNVGLAAATAAGLVALIWLTVSWIAVSANLAAGHRDGSAQVAIVADARIAALQARADEALTLVARGSGADAEKNFAATMTKLAGADGTGGVLAQASAQATDPAVRNALATAVGAVADWRTVHKKLRDLDDGGQYPQAVLLAIGNPGTAGGSADGDKTSAASAFNRVDDALAAAIARANATFDDRAGSADSATTGAAIALAVLIVVLLAGLIVGLQQRIAEYR